MKRLSPTIRISISLVCLTLSLLTLALVLGLLPDREGAILEGRKAYCEQLAMHSSFALQQGDLETAWTASVAAVQRHPDVLSAAVRTADGNILVEVGEHKAHWDRAATAPSTPTHMRVPIALKDKLWGHIEVRFRPTTPPVLGIAFSNPLFPLLGFLALTGFVVYLLYLRVLFRGLGLAESSVVPRRVRTTINTLTEGLVILDTEQRIVLANDAFATIIGRRADDLRGRKVAELSWTPKREGHAADLPWERALGGDGAQMGTLLAVQSPENRLRTLSVNSTPIVADDGTCRGALATFDNLTSIEKKNAHLRKLLERLKHSRANVRRQNQELKTLATRDPLTGCLNRRAFFPEFEMHWEAASRHWHPLSCVMVDIDHFKSVNDTHGHSTGDQVLQMVAETLKSMMRKSDRLCRYGGEEFCILLPYLDVADAIKAAERFRQGIADRKFGNLSVTASLGVSAVSLGGQSPHEQLDQADKALYAAKRRGRNRVVCWSDVAHEPDIKKPDKARTDPPRDLVTNVAIPFHAVTALLSALAFRHSDTAEHSRRVADLCVATVNGLLSQSECYLLEVAALLHDIGKLGVPDAVLLKPGPLTAEEWKVIRTHEGIGDEIIEAAFSSPELSAIVVNHHCWYGGSPHDPDLPKGKDIPLGARVLAISDAYDAMVSDRVYRKGMSREAAFAELRRCAGVQFDPELVERFINTILARDERQSVPAVPASRQAALQIGVQIEKLASALDAQDLPTLAAMAGHLSTTARLHGIAPIAEVAARLGQAAANNPDRVEITQLTVDLLDLCRGTYRSYLDTSCAVPA